MKLDPSQIPASAGTTALPANGRVSDVRRNGWLYSLEHALLDSGLKPAESKPENKRSGAPGERVARNRVTQESGSREDRTPHPSLQARATEAQALQSRPIPSGSTSAERPHRLAVQASERQGNTEAKAGSADVRPPRKGLAAIPAGSGGGTPVSASAWLAANSVAAQSLLAGIASRQSTQATQAPPLGATDAQASPAPAPSIPISAVFGTPSAMASAPFIDTAPATSPDPVNPKTSPHASESEPAIERSAGVLHAGSGEPYGRRQLHVHVGEEGLQAWVRDADLSPAAAFRVAGAFRDNARYGGPALAALTINGKKVVDTAPSRRTTSNPLTQTGKRMSQPGELEHGN